MKTVLHLPMTAYRSSDSVRVRGQAADVATPFDDGVAADGADMLDHGQASPIAPLLGLVKPIASFKARQQRTSSRPWSRERVSLVLTAPSGSPTSTCERS
jgi:hypothetical protein